jgi:hypothetical protein
MPRSLICSQAVHYHSELDFMHCSIIFSVPWNREILAMGFDPKVKFIDCAIISSSYSKPQKEE